MGPLSPKEAAVTLGYLATLPGARFYFRCEPCAHNQGVDIAELIAKNGAAMKEASSHAA